MKKLVFMLAGVACAVSLQAATFNWASDDSSKTGRLYGLAADGVKDNATGVAASGTLSDRLDKGTYSLQAMITLFTAGGDEVGSSSWVDLVGSTKGGAVANGMTVDAAAASTEYSYRIDIKGTQGTLTGKGTKVDGGDGFDYDYSAAIIESSITGDVRTEAFGTTAIEANPPSTWEVSDIAKTAQSSGGGGEGVPEPTSGLLLLVGGAMLALRRKQK